MQLCSSDLRSAPRFLEAIEGDSAPYANDPMWWFLVALEELARKSTATPSMPPVAPGQQQMTEGPIECLGPAAWYFVFDSEIQITNKLFPLPSTSYFGTKP
jgi:hypothetical protein